MIELLMFLILPGETNIPELGIKYILKEQFVNYQTCQEYVEKNLYFKKEEEVGIFYTIDTKEYRVYLTYCKPVKENE